MQNVRLATVDTSSVVDSAAQLERYKQSFSCPHVYLPASSALRFADACGDSFQVGDPQLLCRSESSSRTILRLLSMQYAVEHDVLLGGEETASEDFPAVCSCGSIFECIIDTNAVHHPFIVVITESLADEPALRKQIKKQDEDTYEYLQRVMAVLRLLYPPKKSMVKRSGYRGRGKVHVGDVEAERDVSIVDLEEQDLNSFLEVERRWSQESHSSLIELMQAQMRTHTDTKVVAQRQVASNIAKVLDKVTAEQVVSCVLSARVQSQLQRLQEQLSMYRIISDAGVSPVDQELLSRLRTDINTVTALQQTVVVLQAARTAVDVNEIIRRVYRKRSVSAQARTMRAQLQPCGVATVDELPIVVFAEHGTVVPGAYAAFPISLSHLREVDIVLPENIPAPVTLDGVVTYLAPPPRKSLFVVTSESAHIGFAANLKVLSAHFPVLPAVRNELISMQQIPRKCSTLTTSVGVKQIVQMYLSQLERCKAIVDLGADSVSLKKVVRTVAVQVSGVDMRRLLQCLGQTHYAGLIDASTVVYPTSQPELSLQRNGEATSTHDTAFSDSLPACLQPQFTHLMRLRKGGMGTTSDLIVRPMYQYMKQTPTLQRVAIVVGQPGSGKMYALSQLCKHQGVPLTRMSACDISRLARQKEVFNGAALNALLGSKQTSENVLVVEQSHLLRGSELLELVATEAFVILCTPSLSVLRSVPYSSQVIPSVAVVCTMAVPLPAERIQLLAAMGDTTGSPYSEHMHGASTSDLYQVLRASQTTEKPVSVADRLVFSKDVFPNAPVTHTITATDPSLCHAPMPLYVDPLALGEQLAFFYTESTPALPFGFGIGMSECSSTGVLLSGCSGQGKTFLASALALHSGLSVLRLSPSSLLKAGVGEAEKALRDIFIQAKRVSPSIVIVDNVQTVFHPDIADIEGGESLLAQFATILDQLYLLKEVPSKRVLVQCTAEHYSQVHPLLLRKGRVETHVPLPLLGRRARRSQLQSVSSFQSLASDEQRCLVHLTEGCTVGELQSLHHATDQSFQGLLEHLLQIKERWTDDNE